MDNKKLLTIILFTLVGLILFFNIVFAGDTHQDTQSHAVVVVITGGSGRPATGETVRLNVKRVSDEAYLDFDDLDFDFMSDPITTPWQTMNEDVVNGTYWIVVTLDTATLVSGDYITTISVDSGSNQSHATEVISWNETHNLIRIHR